jgi:hypothetical protein
MEVGEQYDVDRVVRDAETLQGNRLEAPKSMQKRIPGASMRKHVLNLPPDPKESPVPTNVTLTDIGLSTVR